jgi:hypothetical protein
VCLTCASYRQKEVPNEAQGDGLHKDAGGSLRFDPPRQIGRARWLISKKRSEGNKKGKIAKTHSPEDEAIIFPSPRFFTFFFLRHFMHFLNTSP